MDFDFDFDDIRPGDVFDVPPFLASKLISELQIRGIDFWINGNAVVIEESVPGGSAPEAPKAKEEATPEIEAVVAATVSAIEEDKNVQGDESEKAVEVVVEEATDTIKAEAVEAVEAAIDSAVKVAVEASAEVVETSDEGAAEAVEDAAEVVEDAAEASDETAIAPAPKKRGRKPAAEVPAPVEE